MKKEIEIYSDDTPLAGENKPPHPKMIDELIKLLATISHRFGNTRVAFSLKWGANALHDTELTNDVTGELTHEEEANAYREVLEEGLQKFCNAVGLDSEFYDRDQSDFSCYADFLDDVAEVVAMHGIKFDKEEGEFIKPATSAKIKTRQTAQKEI